MMMNLIAILQFVYVSMTILSLYVCVHHFFRHRSFLFSIYFSYLLFPMKIEDLIDICIYVMMKHKSTSIALDEAICFFVSVHTE